MEIHRTLVKSATLRGKPRRLLTPTTFSLLHAADFGRPLRAQIAAAQAIICAGRIVTYTPPLRVCRARMPAALLRNLYRFARFSGHHFSFSRAAGCGGKPYSERPPETQIPTSRDDLGLSTIEPIAFACSRQQFSKSTTRCGKRQFRSALWERFRHKLQKQMRDNRRSKIA